MKQLVLYFILGTVLLTSAKAAPKTVLTKGQLASFFNSPASPKFRATIPLDDLNDADDEHMIAELRQADAVEDDEGEEAPVNPTGNKPDASSGRLFKKFLLFKNMFGSSSSTQPVIPIIITGAGTGTTGNTGGVVTTTVTETGTLPTATGTITTSPVTAREGQYSPEEEEQENAEVQQELQAALAAGQEYVVTDQEIRGTSESKQPVASNQPSQINLKRKGAKRGQVITVRIPQKYRNYFKNGQRVVLNTSTNIRPVKRRVVKKKGNTNRRRKVNNSNNNNLNKRRRVPVAV